MVVPGYQTLVVERRGPVGWLIFDRPDQGNAMNAQMLSELEVAWNELNEDPTVRAIVNTGNGRVFQTGDLDAMREHSRRTKRAELRFTAWHNHVWKPVIAAVNGVCAGGGLHFVADADVAIASSDATFVDPHVSLGQVTAYEAIGLLRKMPAETVMRMALVGRHERIATDRAYQLGMISQIVHPPDQLQDGALEVGLTDACRAGAQELVSMWGHPDQEEGPRAFAEKREPVWVVDQGVRSRA